MTPVLDSLLAKSSGGPSPPDTRSTLAGHLAATEESAATLCDATLAAQCSAFGLAIEPWKERARRVLRAAALWHDLGKANDHFLGMLAGTRSERQALRHEAVSLLLALQHPLRDWLRPAFESEEEWHLFLWAVAGHHRKNWPGPPPDGSGTTLTIQAAHPDFAICLAQVAASLALPPPPSFTADLPVGLLSSGAPRQLMAYSIQAGRLFNDLPDDWRKLAALLKSALISADVAASSMASAGAEALDPVANLSRIPTKEDIESIILARLGANALRQFQEEIAATPGRVLLVRAGCGTGKTLAAYLRAAHQPLFQHRRLFFCYPTTGTATEGFRDYVFDSDIKEPKHGSRLYHSRATIDSTLILGQRNDDEERLARASALSLWDTPITVCTVDTVLGLLQNQRTGHYLWPAIANGAFVFDEIHSYDDQLFATLLRFLRDLPGLPVLLMTASLPTPRLDAIRQVLDRNDETLSIIEGPADIEALPRYLPATGEPAPAHRALHVSNTVVRCIAGARTLHALGTTPLVYHSRFKYRDRVQRHANLVEAFKSGGPALACTTQVCEMSLDLSAQVLVTDLAPIPALVQRLGRLNRHNPNPTNPFPFHVVDPGNPLPYSENELDLAREWLATLGPGPLSQKDLRDEWEKLSSSPLEFTNHTCQWLDGGPVTLPASLREGSPNITVLMEEDLPEARRRPQSLPELLLPMPPHRDAPIWRRHKFYPVAPAGSIDYDALLGASWNP